MSMRGSRNSKDKVALIIALLAAIGFLFGGHLFSFISPIPAFPVTTLSSGVTSSYFGGGYVSSGSSIYSITKNISSTATETINVAYVYSIEYGFPVSNGKILYPYGTGGGVYSSAFNYYIPLSFKNQTDVNYSIEQNNATIQDIYSNANNFASNCGTNNESNINNELSCLTNMNDAGSNVAPRMDYLYADEKLLNLVQATNQYIITNENFTSTKNYTVSQSAPVAAKNFNFFSEVQDSVQYFVNNILSSLSQYFKIPSNLFSIGYSGVNAKNISTSGTQINVSVADSIPVQYISNKWTTGTNKVIRTYCGSYVYYNSTKAYVYESPVINMTIANYSNSFSFIPTAVGIYVLGSSCLTSNTTYANGVWSNWTTPSIIYQQNKAIAVVSKNTSVAAPVTSVNISSGFFGSISQDISSFIDGILRFFTNL